MELCHTAAAVEYSTDLQVGGGEVESSSPGRRASDAAKRRRVFT